MLIIGLILTFLTGFSLLCFLSKQKLSIAESVGLSFPMGLFQMVLLISLSDILGIGVHPGISIGGGILLSLLWIVFAKRKKHGLPFFAFSHDWKSIFSSFNLVWLIFFIALVGMEWMNFSKCLYFPTFDRDSVVGFDTIGYLIAQEHTIRNLSVFQVEVNPGIHNPGSYVSYAPLVQEAYAMVYQWGAETSKSIPALMYLSLLFAFYGFMKRSIGATGSIIATFFMMITPEMVSFSSMSGTNVIHAIYAALGCMYGLAYLVPALAGGNSSKTYLYLSAILLAANIYTRYEGVVFPAAVGIFMLVQTIRKKILLKNFAYWCLIIIMPFLIWKIYQRASGMYTENFMIPIFSFDEGKASTILSAFWGLLTNQIYYGWTFILAFIAFIANLWFVIKKRDSIIPFATVFLSIVFYALVLYYVDYVWDSIHNVLAYSAKRFFFCFSILAWFYLSSVYPLRQGLLFLDRKLSLFPSAKKGNTKAKTDKA